MVLSSRVAVYEKWVDVQVRVVEYGESIVGTIKGISGGRRVVSCMKMK